MWMAHLLTGLDWTWPNYRLCTNYWPGLRITTVLHKVNGPITDWDLIEPFPIIDRVPITNRNVPITDHVLITDSNAFWRHFSLKSLDTRKNVLALQSVLL